MNIIGFNFTKIKAEKLKQLESNVKINNNIKIKSIEKEDVTFIKEKDSFKLEFEFSLEFEPKVAELSLEGFILFIIDKKDSKDLLNQWKTKKLPEEIRNPIYNLIFTKCNLKAFQIEEEISLPPHIPLPKLQQKPEETKKRDYTG